MSCPFNKESLDKLKAFIDFCAKKPEIIHSPDLEFFKSYLTSLGANIPESATFTMPDTDTPGKCERNESENTKVDEAVESDPESELEFDMEGCLEQDELDKNQTMGDSTKIPSEEESDEADEKRTSAMSEFAQGNFQKSIELLTQAITLNPIAAVLFVKRGQCYLKLNKPNACIRDCTQALELNPDSAPGFKFRGRAYRLLGKWEDAARDLRQACKIDFDDQTDEWLKEVTPNAQKIEVHRLKVERKKAEKELREKAERLRKAREAHAKAAQADAEGTAGAGEQAAGFPGFGAAGRGGPTGLGDVYQLLQDPEVMAAFQDPEVAAAFQDISKNPGNFIKYQSNPKVMALVAKLSSKFQNSGMPFPGMGGFPGFGAAPEGNETKPPHEDDGLD